MSELYSREKTNGNVIIKNFYEMNVFLLMLEKNNLGTIIFWHNFELSELLSLNSASFFLSFLDWLLGDFSGWRYYAYYTFSKKIKNHISVNEFETYGSSVLETTY